MTEYNFEKNKGQSAIEYLMTYGWMLLVVAIIGGAIYPTIQGQCTQRISGFSGGNVIIENFGLDADGNVQMELRNGGTYKLTINGVSLGPNSETDAQIVDETQSAVSENPKIGVGKSETIRIGNADEDVKWMQSSDGCNDFNLVLRYSIGELDNQLVNVTMTDSIEFS